MINSRFLSKLIDERNSKCANLHIGMIIKKRRKALKLTLQEATKGICCVSYLSKLEHGVIEPKRYVMEEVLQRLDVSKTALRATSEYEMMINSCLESLYFNKADKIKSIFETLTSAEKIHFADVIEGIYHFSLGEYDHALRCIQRAFDVKEHLNDLEITACIIIASWSKIMKNDYADGVDSILTLNSLFSNNVIINKLRCKIIIIGKFTLGEYASIHKYIDEYIRYCAETADFEGIKLAKLYSAMTMAANGEKEDSYEIMDLLYESLTEKERNDWNKCINILLGNMEEAKNYDLTLLEKAWIYDITDDLEHLAEVIKDINRENLDSTEAKYYEAICKKVFENDYFYFLYLRDILYPYAINHGMFILAKYCKDRLLDYYNINNKYREAVRTIKQFEEIKTKRWKR